MFPKEGADRELANECYCVDYKLAFIVTHIQLNLMGSTIYLAPVTLATLDIVLLEFRRADIQASAASDIRDAAGHRAWHFCPQPIAARQPRAVVPPS